MELSSTTDDDRGLLVAHLLSVPGVAGDTEVGVLGKGPTPISDLEPGDKVMHWSAQGEYFSPVVSEAQGESTRAKNEREIERLKAVQVWRTRYWPVYERQGFVRLVDVVGDDFRPVEAAQLTSGKVGGSQSADDSERLLRFLKRHRHDTPFEFSGLHLHIQMPMDVMRQFIRHRVLSVNEWSTRYSEPVDAPLTTAPWLWRQQASSNRQGSDGRLPDRWEELAGPSSWEREEEGILENTPGEYLSRRERELHALAADVYQERLEFGVAREQARKDLPLSTMTQVYVECDIRCWMHFLQLRLDKHAQAEIRELSEAISRIFRHFFPRIWSAFKDYELDALTFTGPEIKLVQRYHASEISLAEVAYRTEDRDRLKAEAEMFAGIKGREFKEFVEKLRKLNPVEADPPLDLPLQPKTP